MGEERGGFGEATAKGGLGLETLPEIPSAPPSEPSSQPSRKFRHALSGRAAVTKRMNFLGLKIFFSRVFVRSFSFCALFLAMCTFLFQHRSREAVEIEFVRNVREDPSLF